MLKLLTNCTSHEAFEGQKTYELLFEGHKPAKKHFHLNLISRLIHPFQSEDPNSWGGMKAAPMYDMKLMPTPYFPGQPAYSTGLFFQQ